MTEGCARRVTDLVKGSGLSIRELGRKIGVSNVSIGKWMKGQFAPSGKALEAFCNYFDVSPAFVLYGEGKGAKPDPLPTNTISIPLYNVTSSCGGGVMVDAEEIIRMIKVSPEFIRKFAHGANPNTLNIITVHGDSMMPTVADGDAVIIDTSDNRVTRDGLYAVQMDGCLFVKRLQITPRGIRVISDNHLYPAIDVGEQDSFFVIGKCYVGALLRSLL